MRYLQTSPHFLCVFSRLIQKNNDSQQIQEFLSRLVPEKRPHIGRPIVLGLAPGSPQSIYVAQKISHATKFPSSILQSYPKLGTEPLWYFLEIMTETHSDLGENRGLEYGVLWRKSQNMLTLSSQKLSLEYKTLVKVWLKDSAPHGGHRQ